MRSAHTFTLALALATAALILPLWQGDMPFLTDFGGHLEMADAWARLDESPFLRLFYERRDAVLAPNMLAARFVGLCHPWLEPLSALRLFVSLSLLALVGTLLWTIATWQRSGWLVFLALPFIWGGALTLGLINYVASFPLMFAALCLGRRLGRSTGRSLGSGLALLGVTLLAFFVHGIGLLMVIGFGAVGLLASLKRWDRVAQMLWMFPSLVLWLRWHSVAEAVPWHRGATFGSHSYDAHWLLREALNPLSTRWDEHLLWVVLGLGLGLVWAARQQPAGAPAAGSVRDRCARALDRHTPLFLAAGMSIAYLALPAFYRGVSIDTRLVTPMLLCAVVGIPLGDRALETRLGRFGVIGSLVLAVVFFGALIHANHGFQRDEIRHVVLLLDRVPPYQRVTCAGVHEARPRFLRLPLNHGCDALAQIRTDGFAGGGFAHTVFNAMTLKPGASGPALVAGLDGPLEHWDYVLVRGGDRTTAERRARLVDESGAWALYRVLEPEVPEALRDFRASGADSRAGRWCEAGCPGG